MKTFNLNILTIGMAVLLLVACKKDKASREALAEGRVNFDLPASVNVVTRDLDVKKSSVVSVEMKAALDGDASSDVHYVTFATDTTKIADYKLKYDNSALLLPTNTYLYYKSTVAIPAGTKVSEAAVLNLGFQRGLKPLTAYVLPLVITSVDGKPQDPKTRKVVYYVFKTGEPLYIQTTGFTATASSTLSPNSPIRATDGNLLGNYWTSGLNEALPQWVRIDFGREIKFSGLDVFFPTAVDYTTFGGDPTSAKVEISSDDINWTDKGTYVINVRNPERKQSIDMASITTARYLRFTALAGTRYANMYNLVFVSEIAMKN
jgi:hypothetical protein